ncbi:glycosyltransferase family 2 protein [Malacoplasma penetrans]|uniref:Glycosyltransferase n=1 Tax=Malacoplasma penetrans (strain HF-2) TaxID=272633 RepID=Q8EX23_MALP2|nr:glycosyltransferase family A protein [Malacoplasma penetrans]RXY97390.1 glycosyltransferase family 2 protein [Malacoplasma penetrans]BAC43817.1 glycosyltransferase [Malacoplasma penetrans HF-2]
MKKVSVIIPFKNTPLKWIKQLITSLNNQTNKNFEVFFIDDNSTNPQVYIDLINKNGYQYVQNIPNNIGVGKIRDYGVTLANGEYIWFVDSDDWLYVDAIDYLLKSFYKYQNIDFIMFEYEWVFDKKQINLFSKHNQFDEIIVKNNVNKSKMPWFHNNYQTDWRVCFKKEFLVKNKISHPDKVNIFEDVYFGLIWKVLYKKALLTSKKLYFYNRLNVESSLNTYKYKANDLVSIIFKNKNYLLENKLFNNNWYFYASNWLGALNQLNYIDLINVQKTHNKFIGNNNFYNLETIGFHKIWFIYKALWIKKVVS